MELFTLAHHRGLCGDAYLIDTARSLSPLHVAAPAADVVAALLDRVLLMGRSPHAVRDETFAVFWAGDCTVAVTSPVAAGAHAALRDTLAAFGTVEAAPSAPAHGAGLHALLAYERGALAFFDDGPTRPFRALAGKHGVRVVLPAYTHAPDDELFVGDQRAAAFLTEPEEISFE